MNDRRIGGFVSVVGSEAWVGGGVYQTDGRFTPVTSLLALSPTGEVQHAYQLAPRSGSFLDEVQVAAGGASRTFAVATECVLGEGEMPGCGRGAAPVVFELEEGRREPIRLDLPLPGPNDGTGLPRAQIVGPTSDGLLISVATSRRHEGLFSWEEVRLFELRGPDDELVEHDLPAEVVDSRAMCVSGGQVHALSAEIGGDPAVLLRMELWSRPVRSAPADPWTVSASVETPGGFQGAGLWTLECADQSVFGVISSSRQTAAYPLLRPEIGPAGGALVVDGFLSPVVGTTGAHVILNVGASAWRFSPEAGWQLVAEAEPSDEAENAADEVLVVELNGQLVDVSSARAQTDATRPAVVTPVEPAE